MDQSFILPNILIGLVVFVVAYIFGSLPTGVLVGKVFFHTDIRDHGSKNTGGTNAGRVLGKKIGIAVIALDMIKTVIPIYATWALLTYVPYLNQWMHWENGYYAAPLFYWLAALFCTIGHCFSVFLKFKGGKAVSCYMGANVLVSWVHFLIVGFSYLSIAKKTKLISLTSIITSIIGIVLSWGIAIIAVTTGWEPNLLTWVFVSGAPYLGIEFAIVNTIISAILVIRHKANIERIRNGTESKNPFAKSE